MFKDEPFAELARIKDCAGCRATPCGTCYQCADRLALAKHVWQAASPTPEQYAQAARQIAERQRQVAENTAEFLGMDVAAGALSEAEIEQILHSTLGQP